VVGFCYAGKVEVVAECTEDGESFVDRESGELVCQAGGELFRALCVVG
jgi:hypothetical protein